MKRKSQKWTKEDRSTLKILKQSGLTNQQIAKVLGRTVDAVASTAFALNSKKPGRRRFTSEDDEYIIKAYAEYIPLSDMAQHLKRTIGVLRQRVLHLKLVRAGRRSRLVSRYGLDRVNVKVPVEEMRATIEAEEAAKREANKQVRTSAVQDALIKMQANISAGADRKTEYLIALAAGSTLHQIGEVYGLTRERIRQVASGENKYRKLHSLGDPVTATCKGCGKPFEFTWIGKRKAYCSAGCYPAALRLEKEDQPTIQLTAECSECHQPFSYKKPRLGAPRKLCNECARTPASLRNSNLVNSLVRLNPADLISVLEQAIETLKGSHGKISGPGEGLGPFDPVKMVHRQPNNRPDGEGNEMGEVSGFEGGAGI